MGKFLCHIEAVNLDNVFGDCEDLSTTRGGGLAVLEIATPVVKGLPKDDVLIAGASKGLFRMEGADKAEVEAKIRARLEADDRWAVLKHTTILIEVAEERPDDFASQSVELTNAIRWKQMRAPAVRYPALEFHGGTVCRIDKIRPASRRHDLPEKNEQSDYSNARRSYGLERRSGLVREILADGWDWKVAESLDHLSARDGHPLDHKIAVLRFDGNDFGEIAKACNTSGLTSKFSTVVRKQQIGFFRKLLRPEDGTAGDDWYDEDNRLRIDIVVYGGDEVTFIVPAWLGWRALRLFYEDAHGWVLPRTPDDGSSPDRPSAEQSQEKTEDEKGTPLTYAGGVVFCHHNAPIHEIKRIASGLTDLAKDRAKAYTPEQKKGNYCAYQVLESFDAIGRDLEEYMDERFGKENRHSILGLDEISKIERNMDLWRSKVSKRKLHAAAMAVLSPEPDPAAEAEPPPPEELDERAAARSKKLLDSLFEAKDKGSDEGKAAIEELHAVLGDSVFVHLLELWDYAAGDNR